MNPRNRAQIVRARWIVAGSALLMSAGCLAACGSDDSSPSRPADVPTATFPVTAGQAGVTAGTTGAAPVGGVGGQAPPAATGGTGSALAGTGAPVGGMMMTGGTGMMTGGTGMMTGGMGATGGTGMMTGGMGGTGATGGTGGSPPVVSGDACEMWKTANAGLTEATWSGDVSSCTAGAISAEAADSALRLVNMYRAFAGLSPVAMSDENNRLAQECALLMEANGSISHTPPPSWTCNNDERTRIAGSSSLSGQPSVASVSGYMIDPGNPTTIGHRRWILSQMLAGVGFGSSNRWSCQYQPPSRASNEKAWVAWPPDGQVPIQAFGARFSGNIDQTGWTIESDSVNLGNAQVTVSSGGMDLAVSTTQLLPGYGSRYAIRFNPSGWSATAGQTYHVKVDGAAMPIEYDVQVVDCP